MLSTSASRGFKPGFIPGLEHGSDATGKLFLSRLRIVMLIGVFAI
jgi:hypothetical protein